MLVLEIKPGTAVILDKLAPHRNEEAKAALKAYGCWFLYLPPYSPDLNPIKMVYSKPKAHLRRAAVRTFDTVFTTNGEICDLFDPGECRNFFKPPG